jgi:hypothetical protein
MRQRGSVEASDWRERLEVSTRRLAGVMPQVIAESTRKSGRLDAHLLTEFLDLRFHSTLPTP